MKPNRSNPLLAAVVFASVLASVGNLHAVNLYWDGNGDTAGAGATPTGIWGTDLFWNTTANGDVTTPTNAATTGLDDLFFSAGADAVNPYTVTVNDSQNARLLTFEDGTATLSGGTSITLGGGGGITVGTSTVTGATISTALTINGNNTFNVGSGRTLTLDSGAFTRGTLATLNVQGAGTVTTTKSGLASGGLVNGIIGPWASFGIGASTQYATIDGSNNIVGLTGTAAATAANVTDTGGTFNYDMAAGGTSGAGANINTLRYTGSGPATIAATNPLIAKGIMNASSDGGLLTFSNALTAGLGAGAGTSATELVLNAASGNIALNGLVTGAITKTGSGTVTLSGTPVHSLGAWTVNEGILILNAGLTPVTNAENVTGGTINSGGTARLGESNRVANGAVITINAGGIFDLNGKTDLIGGISGAGSVTNTGAIQNLQLGNTTQTFSGVISGGLNLRKRNGGDQILSGANTFTGTTAITNAGTTATLTLANSLALQNSALDTTTSVVGTAAIGLRTTVTTLTLGGLTGNKDLALVFRQDASGGPGGTTALGGYSGVTALTLNPGVERTYSAGIADGATGMTLTKTGAGTQILSGTNTYTGLTTVSVGTLRLGHATDTLSNSGAINVNGGILDIAGNSDTVGAVTLTSGSITGSGGTLTGSSYAVQSGSISAILGGTDIALAKTTGGTVTLTGSNTFTGATTISGGTLQISGTGRLNGGSYAGAIAIDSGAALEIIAGATQTLSGTISGGGTLSHNSSGQTILQTATNSFGALTVGNASGRVFINTFASLPSAATVSVTNGNLVFAAGATYNTAIAVGDGGALTARNASVLSNVTLPGTGTVIFQNDDATTSTLSIGGTQTLTGSLTVQIGGARTNANALGAVTLSGQLTGSGPLVVTNTGNVAGAAFGTGSLILSNSANDYTGGTTLNRGTLGLGADGTLGATSGALAVNNTNDVAAGNAVVLNLATAADTTVGSLSGTISTPTSGTNTATINTQTGRNFTVNQTANGTYQGVIAGDGGFTLGSLSTQTLTLTGNNTHTGTTTIAAGTLAISGGGTIANTPRIQINSSTTLDVSGVSGTFTLGAGQTLTGGGMVLAGGKTVTVAGTLAPGASPGTLTQDGGGIGGAMELAVGGDYNWQIHDASGVAGTGYDTTNLINDATLDLSLLSAGNTFNINLWSLSATGPDADGNSINFNNALAYSWTMFSTGEVITGFSTDKFTIHTGAFNGTNGFTNDLGGGAFNVGLADGGTDLVLNFTPIPEPRAALLGGLGLLALLRRRRD